MWDSRTFAQFLKDQGHGDKYNSMIYPTMKRCLIGENTISFGSIKTFLFIFQKKKISETKLQEISQYFGKYNFKQQLIVGLFKSNAFINYQFMFDIVKAAVKM